MKTLQLVMLGLLLLAVTVRAQSDPGREQINASVSTVQAGSGFQSLIQPEFSPVSQSAAAIAEAITPDIQALAGNLGNDPTRIFNYVHDQIRYVHYFGSKKGAELTLLERSGNDFDQCALLSALLQAAGFTNNNLGYQFGYMKIPYDNPDGTLRDLHHWLGLSMLNTNWINTSNFFGWFQGTRGFSAPTILFSNDTNHIGIQRLWVTFANNGTNYYLDPSFKVSVPVTNINLSSAMGLNTSTLLSNAGGTDTGNYVSGLNESSLRNSLQSCNSNLLLYLSNNTTNATVAQVVGGQQIISSSGLPLANALLFPLVTNSTYPFLNWTNQPTNFMSGFSISLGGTNQTWWTPQLQGQRIALTFSTNRLAQLWLEDALLLQTTNTGTSNTVNVILSATHPYGSWNTTLNSPTDTGYFDRSSTNTYQATNASYAIMYAFEASPSWLQERQLRLDAYRQQGFADLSRQVTTETLNVMGLDWMVQTELSLELLGQEWGQLPEHQHRFGRMGQEAGRGYYVDVYLQLDGSFPNTSYNAPDIVKQYQAFDVSSYLWSGMEHGIIEQLQNSNLVAASTVKMLEIASTNSQPVYLLNFTNYGSVLPYLTGYSASASNTIITLIESGYTLLLPQVGNNPVAGAGTWAGDGYVELGTSASGRTMGMIIGGGYNGGFVDNPSATPSPGAVSTIDDNQQNTYNPQSPTLPLSGQTGLDPVNLVDGSFEVTATDLSLGQTEPRGLHLTRYYSSARRTSNPAGMGPGWLHNYFCTAVPVSAPALALGQATAQQEAPMIVATFAALNLYNYVNVDPKNWLVTALIAKWGVDQLINNSVCVNLGKDSLQFVKQPGGQYTPPANCTMTLVPTNGAFWLAERHGRTFQFGGNTLLTNIVDQYGQKMRFYYNTNNFVTNIVDWVGHSLSFTYSNSVLTNVADSTGRSVSYGYSGPDLTTFFDAEQKTNGYAYDTNHDVLAAYDALGRLVVTNFYDGFGHVNIQFTQGLTNKMWQIFPSGYYTVEIDPAGDQKSLTYDNQFRLIAQQDALGNVTQIAYDGQDHVIQTVSPLGETNQFIYDGNNNLIATIDPLGNPSQFIYDTNNNLVKTIDADNHSPATYEYNTQFSLTGQTNGAGDWLNYGYNANGTLHSKTDIAGTTTFGYDTSGQLNNIAYPSGLGGEGFFNSPLGDVLIHTNGRGFTSAFSYNARRQLTNSVAPTNLVTSIIYDAVGNALSTTDARTNTTSHTWSVTRHLLTTTFPSTPSGAPVITNGYDARDWLTRTADPLNHPTTFTNDPDGRLVFQAAPVNQTNWFAYDADGRKFGATNAAGETTLQTWDARGGLIRLTDGAGHVSVRAYDNAGNQTTLTNRNTNTWQFRFDAANRLTSTITPTNRVGSVGFNHQGLLANSTNMAGQPTAYFYDAKGRLTNRVDNLDAIAYGHDAADNLTGVTEAGLSAGWTYDAYDRVATYVDENGYGITNHYDNNGNLTQLVYPGGRTVTYAYDSLNRLTNVTDWSNRKTALTYDLASHLTSITRPNGTYRTISYDAAGETTNIWEQMANGLPIAWFRLNWTNSGNMNWEFAAPLPHTNTPPVRSMAYDVDNRLASFKGPTMGSPQAVTVDLDGNLTSGPLTNDLFTNYAYDVRDRLTHAGGVTNFYDALNNRLGQTYGTNTTTYVVNPNAALPQVLMRVKNGVSTYYIYGAGLLYQITETATATNTLTYHYDYRGSTVALSGDSGVPTDRIEYSLYGSTTYRAGTNDTPFLFNGRYGVQTDPNGLLYMQARYYNPYLCRFINPDPSGFKGGLNFYAYANGNPVSYLDPFGLDAQATGDSDNSWLYAPTLNQIQANEPADTFDKTLGFLSDTYQAYQEYQAAADAQIQAQAPTFNGNQVPYVNFMPGPGGIIGGLEAAGAEETSAATTFFHYTDNPNLAGQGLTSGSFVTDAQGLTFDRAIGITYLDSPAAIYEYPVSINTGIEMEPLRPVMGLNQWQLPSGTPLGTIGTPTIVPRP